MKMHIVHVAIRVKAEYIEEFKKATMENSRCSLQEAGVARFDVLQQQEDPASFLLAEAYYTAEDQLRHRETEHFKKWKTVTGVMLAEQYTFIKYNNVCPDDKGWRV